MNSPSSEEIEQAVLEYLEAIDELKGLRDKYFTAGRGTSGEPIISAEMLTEVALAELKEAANKVAEKWEKCTELRRR